MSADIYFVYLKDLGVHQPPSLHEVVLASEYKETQALLAEARTALKQAVDCIDPGDGSRYEYAYLNALHFLAKTAPGVDSSQDDASVKS